MAIKKNTRRKRRVFFGDWSRILNRHLIASSQSDHFYFIFLILDDNMYVLTISFMFRVLFKYLICYVPKRIKIETLQ